MSDTSLTRLCLLSTSIDIQIRSRTGWNAKLTTLKSHIYFINGSLSNFFSVRARMENFEQFIKMSIALVVLQAESFDPTTLIEVHVLCLAHGLPCRIESFFYIQIILFWLIFLKFVIKPHANNNRSNFGKDFQVNSFWNSRWIPCKLIRTKQNDYRALFNRVSANQS